MQRIVFLTLIIIFIASSTLAVKGMQMRIEENEEVAKEVEYQANYKPIPILNEKTTKPILTALSIYAADIDSGLTLYEKNSEEPILPASTTKIVTALVAMDYYLLDDVITVGDISVPGQKMNLVKNEKISARDLLYGLLIFSANDAAEVLAEGYPGGRGEFIDSMNRKAEKIKLSNTSFTNPTGLDGGDHYSTARDLVRAASYAIQKPFFAEVVATTEKKVTSIDGKTVHNLTNINELVGEIDGVLGVKTGWTENAQENLITFINRDEKRVMIALLGSEDRFSETKELIDWIFDNYSWEEVAGPEVE
jgi:D-alanyl-D-alanine carboxypeptidase (penicillin-binding protein 5/6)